MSHITDGWRAAWLRGGPMSDVAWIGQDALAWCSSLYLVIYDLASGRLRLPHFTHEVIQAGAHALSGSFNRPIFAFAEKHTKPRILVFAYPSMKRLCKCNKGTTFAYLATAFTGDYLVSLGSMPDFKLIIWTWRDGNKIASIDTSIHDAGLLGQSLRASFSVPAFIAQIGNTTGKLLTWEMIVCSTTAILRKNEVIMPKKAMVKDVAWCPQHTEILAIVDQDGHIYMCNSHGEELKRIVLSQHCGVCLTVETAAICWYRGGIVLRTTFCQIRYYQENDDNVWKRIWYSKLDNTPCSLTSNPFRDDQLFFTTQEGQIVQINFSEDGLNATMDVKYFNGGKYKFVNFIRPWCEIVVAVDQSMELSVIEASEGAEIARVNLDIKGCITAMLTHPDYPILVVCSEGGEIVFISLLKYHNPNILGKYWIQEEALQLMKFSTSGRYLAVCQKDPGNCYILNTAHTRSISVRTQVEVSSKIVDVLMFEAQTGVKLFILTGSINKVPIGNKLLIYDLPTGQTHFKKLSTVICLEHFYKNLHYAVGGTNTFVGTPYLTKHLTFFKFNDWKDLTCYSVVANGHNVRQVRIFTSKLWIVTTCIDGSVIIRSTNVKNTESMYFMTHHLQDLGVRRATVNSVGDITMALGANGSIVAVRRFESEKMFSLDLFYEFGYVEVQDHEYKVKEYMERFNKQELEFLSNPVEPFAEHSEESSRITWVEWKRLQSIEKERKSSAKEKKEIISSFHVLKNKIINLLNKNETCSDLEKLPISAFALDKAFREKRMKMAKDEREEVRHELESDSLEMRRVTNWIQTKFWKPQKVLGRSIFGIFDQTEVTNYTITAERSIPPDVFEFGQFARNVIAELKHDDTVYPWETLTDKELNLIFEKQLRVKKSDEVVKIDKFIETEEEADIDVSEDQNKLLFEGLTIHHFIEPCAPYYPQFKLYSFSQILTDNCNIAEDRKQLRMHLNKMFDDMFSVKEREMNLVHERSERIIHIRSELQLMFNEIVGETFACPTWHPKEKAETIVQVTDDELSARPYISPSQQDMLDRQAAEEERARQALLADDFRVRALQTMMDGVLEVRWEDLIKRDVPQPEVMESGKKPDELTDEEVAAIKKYELEVKNLENDRERYRKSLLTDYARISGALKDSVERFNSRLEEFHLVKMKIEAAIQQLELRYVRYYIMHIKNLDVIKRDDHKKLQIKKKYDEIESIAEEIKIIKHVDQELHNYYESLTAKDKYMEKKLKSEFTTLRKNAFEAIFLQYKRRPRLVLKTTSPAEMLDLGKCTTSLIKLPYLTSECRDYLRQLDALDVRPQNLPATIEPTHWANLVALRRLKIGHELYQRSVAIEMEEATGALTNYNRKVVDLRAGIEALRAELTASRAACIEDELDAELQLVLKMGQVEVGPLLGKVGEDTQTAVFVPKCDIDRVNEAIVKAGRKKLRAIERSLEFKRGIASEDWEYECLETKLKNFGVELYYVRMANVTREVQELLRRRKQGKKEDKTPQRMERDFEATRKNQESMLKTWETKLKDVSKEVQRLQDKNMKLDTRIVRLNVDRCDMELQLERENKPKKREFRDKIEELLAERASVRKLLENYEELVEFEKEQQRCACNKPTTTRPFPPIPISDSDDTIE